MQASHPNVIRVVILEVLLAAQRVHHRRLERLSEFQQFGVSTGASDATQ